MLELDNCLLITDVTLEHLENCHNLERIELYDCQQVTRAGIKRIRVCVSWLVPMEMPELVVLLEVLGVSQAREGWINSLTILLLGPHVCNFPV